MRHLREHSHGGYQHILGVTEHWFDLIAFVPKMASMETPLSCPCFNMASCCHSIWMPILKGMLPPCNSSRTTQPHHGSRRHQACFLPPHSHTCNINCILHVCFTFMVNYGPHCGFLLAHKHVFMHTSSFLDDCPYVPFVFFIICVTNRPSWMFFSIQCVMFVGKWVPTKEL
jgi:hypothetical protein